MGAGRGSCPKPVGWLRCRHRPPAATRRQGSWCGGAPTSGRRRKRCPPRAALAACACGASPPAYLGGSPVPATLRRATGERARPGGGRPTRRGRWERQKGQGRGRSWQGSGIAWGGDCGDRGCRYAGRAGGRDHFAWWPGTAASAKSCLVSRRAGRDDYSLRVCQGRPVGSRLTRGARRHPTAVCRGICPGRDVRPACSRCHLLAGLGQGQPRLRRLRFGLSAASAGTGSAAADSAATGSGSGSAVASSAGAGSAGASSATGACWAPVYWTSTASGMRPRPGTGMPFWFAHARTAEA